MPLTGVRIFAEKWFASDEQFNQLYPLSIQALARRHWTPLSVARKAAGFLAAENNVRILDIGSGVGKFCLAAAYYKPKAFYYGIEQRKSLVSHAEKAREIQMCIRDRPFARAAVKIFSFCSCVNDSKGFCGK